MRQHSPPRTWENRAGQTTGVGKKSVKRLKPVPMTSTIQRRMPGYIAKHAHTANPVAVAVLNNASNCPVALKSCFVNTFPKVPTA